MTPADSRIESDSLGELRVPAAALWGAQTQRAIENFPVSGQRMPPGFIRAVGLIKAAAARANAELGTMAVDLAGAIDVAAMEVASGGHADQFPVDVFQTGSGTSSNMNVNEVIAHLASRRLGRAVHPNDHVNMGQSSNDVVPSALHVSAALALRDALHPALATLIASLRTRESELAGVAKTGRTHLMDAMPLTFGQELSGWRAQIENAQARLRGCEPRLYRLAQGATAVGTGINAHPRFGALVCVQLARLTGIPFEPNPNGFEALASQDTAAECSGQLRGLAIALTKIANDLRWMNSGPLAGLGEITLPVLQPGSSIMPGKVNPVIPESVAMVAAQVIGHDAAIALAAQSGSFQLNVMLPLIASNLDQSIHWLASAVRLLAERAIDGFEVNRERVDQSLARNPILVTALNAAIGYDLGAAIAKQAYAEGRPVFDVALERSGLGAAELRRLLDPVQLTRGGLPGRGPDGAA